MLGTTRVPFSDLVRRPELPMSTTAVPAPGLNSTATRKAAGRATAALRTVAPQCAVVILSLHGDRVVRAQAEAAGAAAFVEKQYVEPTLLTAIRQAAGKLD